MLIYILYAIVFTLMLLFYKKDKGIFIPILLLLILNAFRGYSVGTDYSHYLALYPPPGNLSYLFNGLTFNTFIENIGRDKSIEIGWALLNYLGGINSMPFYIVNFIAISIILFFINGMVRKQSPHFYFSIYLFLMLYLFYPSFNIIRQSIAIAIFAYSIRYINENKPVFFLSFCVLALMFHSSAIILPLLYLLKYVKIISVISIILLIVSLIIPFLGWDEAILSFFINENTLQVYIGYLEQTDDSVRNLMGNFYKMFPLILQALIFVYCCIRLKGSNNIYMTLWLLGLIILNISGNFQYLFRISGYFLIAQIIALPLVVYNGKLDMKKDKLFYYAILAYCALIYAYKLYSEYDGIIPYITIFN